MIKKYLERYQLESKNTLKSIFLHLDSSLASGLVEGVEVNPGNLLIT